MHLIVEIYKKNKEMPRKQEKMTDERKYQISSTRMRETERARA